MNGNQTKKSINEILSSCMKWDEWGNLEFDKETAIDKILECINPIEKEITQESEDEKELAIQISKKSLNASNADPDDDLRTISRQFLRLIESLKEIIPIAKIWYAHINALHNAGECDASWGEEISKYKKALEKANNWSNEKL